MLHSLLWPHKLTFVIFRPLFPYSTSASPPWPPSPLWKTFPLAQVAQVASAHGKRFGSPAVAHLLSFLGICAQLIGATKS